MRQMWTLSARRTPHKNVIHTWKGIVFLPTSRLNYIHELRTAECRTLIAQTQAPVSSWRRILAENRRGSDENEQQPQPEQTPIPELEQ